MLKVVGTLTLLFGMISSAFAGGFDHSHSTWTLLLKKYVSEGKVDYAALKKLGSKDLDLYLRSLSAVSPEEYKAWSRDQKLAFWLNAYNAFTLKIVVDHYPVRSIRDIGATPGEAFRMLVVPIQALGTSPLSLDIIEHNVLRKEFKEPLIHFGLVCAAKSCPVLRAEAFQPVILKSQLDSQARNFLNDPTKNRIDPTSSTLWLSPIFNWYRKDFERNTNKVPDFVLSFVEFPVTPSPFKPKFKVNYLEYDWSLNEK